MNTGMEKDTVWALDIPVSDADAYFVRPEVLAHRNRKVSADVDEVVSVSVALAVPLQLKSGQTLSLEFAKGVLRIRVTSERIIG